MARRSGRLILAIVLLGIAARLMLALLLGNELRGLPGIDDQLSYDALAQSLVSGAGWSFPDVWWPSTPAHAQTSFWSFGYSAYLAAVYGLVGPQPVVARVVQAVLAGAAVPYLTYRLGRRMFGEPAGLLGAALAACYGYFIYYAGALMTETFYIVAVLWILDQALQVGLCPVEHSQAAGPARLWSIALRAQPWLVLGLSLGAAALLRQVILLFVPILYIWVLWVRSRRPADAASTAVERRDRLLSTFAGLVATTLVLVALIAPWTFRNSLLFGRFVLLNTNAGFAFFWANHPIHGTNFQALLVAGEYLELIPTELRDLDEAALDSALMSRGLQFVSEDPLRFAQLSASRLKDYFVFWPSTESSLVSNLGRALSYGIYLPFMLYGLVLAFGRRQQRAAIVFLYLFMAVYSLIHLFSWALIRYRLPVDASLMPFAALGVLGLTAGLSRRRMEALSGLAKRLSDAEPAAPPPAARAFSPAPSTQDRH